jgi:hypothetical protein
MWPVLRRTFPAGWAELLVGFRGLPGDVRPVHCIDIESFAQEQLVQSSDVRIVNLAIAHEWDVERIDSLLLSLTGSEEESVGRAKQRWRVFLLGELLRQIGDDPLYDNLKFSEFWAAWGYPSDAPPSTQGRDVCIEPESFYTQASLRTLIDQHRHWLSAEIQRLGGEVC